MRARALVTVALLGVVHVALALGVWWVGRPGAGAGVEASAPAAFQRLAELYAGAAFRSVITFDYVALTDLIARASAWPEVLYVSVEDQSGQILAHSDRSNIGRQWEPVLTEALKARHGDGYREVTASIDGRPNGSNPSVGHVRLAYVAGPVLAAPLGGGGRLPLGMLLGGALLLSVPVGLALSWLRDRSEPVQLKKIEDLTQETEEQRATLADYETRIVRLSDDVVRRTRRVADAEREIGQLLVELKVRAAELEENRAAIATLEGSVQSAHLRVDDEVRQRHARAVGYIVHAIRSSLTNVLGFSKLLLRGTDGTLTDTQRADALNIHFAGKHLLTVVNDLVDLTQLENGTLKLKEDLVDVRGLLDDAMTTAMLPGRSAGDVLVDCPPTLPLVKADRSRLVQILETVVEQAPESGRITLQARGTEDVVELIVTWPRPAAMKTLDELCEPFPPANPVSPIQDGGRRLRLAVARGLALATGGTIAVQHSAAATSFTLTLPATIETLTAV